MPTLPANFCVAPFLQLTTHPSGSFSPCPYLGGTTWSGQYDTIGQAWASPDLEHLREQFLRGERAEVCSRCWHEEDNGKRSLRLRLFDPQSRTSDFAVINNSDLVDRMAEGIGSREYLQGPKVLTIKNGNVCNAKCRSCHPGDSSRWIEDARKLQTQLGRTFYRTDHGEKNWSEQQLEEIFQMAGSLVRMELFGGEPLYNKKVIDLLRRLVETGHSQHIALYINTNGSVDMIDLLPELIGFAEIEIGVSLDHTGAQFNYMRHGLDYQQVVHNIRRWQDYLDQKSCKYFIDSISTVSVLNILDLPEIRQEILGLLPQSPFWNLLVNPDWLFIRHMPDRVKSCAIDRLHTHAEFQDLISVIKQPADPAIWTKFLAITTALDEIRHEDWRRTFPRLADAVA